MGAYPFNSMQLKMLLIPVRKASFYSLFLKHITATLYSYGYYEHSVSNNDIFHY